MGKKIILAFEDFEMSSNETRTACDVVELVRQLLEYQFWYDLEDICRIDLIDFVSIRKTTKKIFRVNFRAKKTEKISGQFFTRGPKKTKIGTIFRKKTDKKNVGQFSDRRREKKFSKQIFVQKRLEKISG